MPASGHGRWFFVEPVRETSEGYEWGILVRDSRERHADTCLMCSTTSGSITAVDTTLKELNPLIFLDALVEVSSFFA